jgi:SAM-dependent methyltransferase
MSYADDLAALNITTTVLGGSATLDMLREAVRLPSKALILDVGCHGGYLSLALADLFAAEVLGVDTSARALALAKRNAERTTHAGSVAFRRGDIRRGTGVREGAFDLVVHRGLEAFVEDPSVLHKQLARAAKNWGYVVNITHTYERRPQTRVVDELNEAAGTHIRPTSRRDLIEAYRAVGLVLVKEHTFDVPIEAVPDLGPAAAARRVQNVLRLAAENDRLTSGALLVFRKPLALSVSDVAKG